MKEITRQICDFLNKEGYQLEYEIKEEFLRFVKTDFHNYKESGNNKKIKEEISKVYIELYLDLKIILKYIIDPFNNIIRAIPFDTLEKLRFFSKLNFSLDDFQTKATNQNIYSWFWEMKSWKQ